MCGLAGVIASGGNRLSMDVAALRRMLACVAHRGPDGGVGGGRGRPGAVDGV